ncbi:MAG: Gfo/Idh/MocA family oxidoreductase [Pseudomonadota bacterium]
MRVGLIGAGYFAAFHAEAWTRLGCDLVVADLDQEKAAAIGRPVPVEALFADPPDIIDIATPPPSHATLIRRALAARPRVIICQKPFCTSLEEARDVAKDAKVAGVSLIVHENIRFQPWYRRIKEVVEAGTLGDLHRAAFSFRTGDGQGPIAYLDRQPYFQTMPRLLIHETGVHWIDTFRFLFGEAEAVDADLQRMNPAIVGEDAGRFTLRYANGLRATFDGDRCLDSGAENPRLTFGTFMLEGTAGTLRLKTDGSVHLRPFKQITETEILPAFTGGGFAGDCVHATNAHVLTALKGDGTFENTALEYITNLEIVEAVYRASETGAVQPLA